MMTETNFTATNYRPVTDRYNHNHVRCFRPYAERLAKEPFQMNAPGTEPKDRRQNPRMNLSRPGKVRHVPTGRFWPAVTWDMSLSGMLLGVDAPRDIQPGDTLEIYVAWSCRPLLRSDDKIMAEVKRVLPRTDGRQLVGVEFVTPLAQPIAAQAA
jgi:hypothetical protein